MKKHLHIAKVILYIPEKFETPYKIEIVVTLFSEFVAKN